MQERTRFVDDEGNVWEATGPNDPSPVFISGPQAGQIIPDPQAPYEGPQAQADLERTRTQTRGSAVDAAVTARTAPTEVATANLPPGMMWNEEGNPSAGMRRIPGGLTPAQEQVDQDFATMYAEMQASGGIADIRKQVGQLRDAVDVLRSSDNITGPVIGRLPEFLQQAIDPRAVNTREQVEEVVQRNLRLILGAQFTQQEGDRLISRAYNPRLEESDNIDRLERLIGQMETALTSRESAINFYEQNGTLAGWTAPSGGDPAADSQNPQTVWDQVYAAAPSQREIAGRGATTAAQDMPDGFQEAHAALVGRLASENGGRIDPRAYASARRSLDQQFGLEPGGGYEDWANSVNTYLDNGGQTMPTGVRPPERDLSGTERFRNDMVSNSVGAGALNAADMVGMGIVRAIDGEGVSAINREFPVASTIGQIGGGITGTGVIGAIGRHSVGRALPRLMGGGGRARFGRGLAADVAYSGGYGAVSGEGALESAALGGVSSVVGQGLGSAVGRGLSGVTSSPAAQRLRDVGVMPTIGQILRGRASQNGGNSLVAGIEDVSANSGFLGNPINAARGRTLEQANIAGMNIGARGQGRVTAAGDEGIAQLEDISGAAYDRALDGVSIPLDDARFGTRMDDAMARGSRVDADRGTNDFGLTMRQDVLPILGRSPDMNGEMLQDTMRTLSNAGRDYRRAASGTPAYRSVADAFDGVSGAIVDAAGEYAPDAVPALDEANSIYRNLSILDDAAYRGRNDGGVFTGAQLGTAMGGNARRYGTGRNGISNMRNMDLRQLQQDMTEVLPNQVPPTGANAAPALALAGAAGAGLSASSDDPWVQTGGGVLGLGLLALPYTRGGQSVAARALLDRPESIRNAGLLTRRRAGLFGSGMAAPLIASN